MTRLRVLTMLLLLPVFGNAISRRGGNTPILYSIFDRPQDAHLFVQPLLSGKSTVRLFEAVKGLILLESSVANEK